MNQLPSSQRSARRRRPVRGVGSHKRRRYLGLPLLPHRDPRFRAGTVWLAVMLMAGGLLSAVAVPTTATTGTTDPAAAQAAGPGPAATATDESGEPSDEAPADDESAGEPPADESDGNQVPTGDDPAAEPTEDAPAEKTPSAEPGTGGPSSAEPEQAEAPEDGSGSDARIAPLAIAADGVQFNTDVSVPGRLETVWVTVDAPGYVNAWIDFDRDGTFDPSERLFDDAAVDAGLNQLTYTVPAGAGFVPGATTARFRESAAPDQGDDPDAPGDTVDVPRELYDAESVALQQCPVGTVPVPVSVIQNPSFEDRTQDFSNAGSASTISYAAHWYDSHPTGGQYHVFEPGGFNSGPAFPNPPVRAGADGFAFEGGHSTLIAGGGNGGEGAVNTLAVPLNPDATYVGFFSMAAGGYNRDGDGYMQFFGTSDPETGSIPNAAVTPQTAANTELLYTTPVVRYAGDGVRPEWELNTFRLDASQAWDHLRVEVRNETPANDATVAGQVWMNFDDFHMYECDPVQDFGDAPASYGTNLADDGPRHTVVDDLRLGALVDDEDDGFPGADATGDDVDGDADEDAFPGGAVLNPGVTDPTLTVPVTNTTGGDATLYGWIDSDGNGVFGPGEFASIQVPDGATEAVLPFAGISVLQDGTSPMVRLRLTSDTLVDDAATPGVDERALGAAADGEVEDHAAQVATRVPISCTEPFVETFGTGTGYGPPLPGGQTTYRYEGASAVNDGEYGLVSALPGNAGTWWHTGGDRTPGDTDGRLMLVNADYTPGIFFQRTFTQLSPGADYDFSAWITNANNAGSSILPNVEFRVVDPATGTVLASTQTGDIPNRTSLQWERFGLQFTAPQTTVRLEIANVAPGGNGNDLALDDIGFSPVCEFGDAPQRYGTLIADDGAGHIATGPTLGTERDTEPNGQPNPAADGDDVTGSPNDEDAVAGPIETSVGAEVTVTVSATNDYAREVTLAGWVDIDGDGQFQDGERVTLLLPASSGTADYDLTFPALTTTADTYARFRVYGDEVADPRPTGTAGAGEVEDHLVTLLDAELDIDKASDATIDARPGDTIEYTVTATNNGPGDFTAANPARVRDDLSGVLDDAVFNDDADTDRGPDPVWANPIVSWTGPLASGDSVTITYTVTLQGGGDGTVRNVAFGQCDPADPDCDPVTPDCDPPVGGVDPDTGKVCDQEELELPKLTIGKVADRSDLPAVGDTVTYSVTVTNEGPGDYTAAAPATATDDLTRVLDDTTAPTNVTADVGTATFNDPELVWEGVLAAGQSATIRYEVTYTGAGDQQVDNAACVPVEEAQDPQDTCAQVRIPGSGLDQDKVADPASGTAVEVGEEITYTLRFSNTGQAPADVDTFDDLAGVLDDAEIVPGSLSADTGLSATFDAADERIEVGGSVPVGGTLEVTYRVRVLGWADQGNHVLRNALQCQPGETQPCDPETTEHPVRALDIEKTSNRTAGTEIGDTVTYTVTAENIGEADYTAADPARVWDDLVGVLDDATYNDDAATVPTASGTISYAQPVIQWVGAIGQGDTITLTYTVDLTGGGDLVVRNVAFGGCDPTDRDCDDATPVCDPPGSDGLDPATGRPCDEEEFGLPRIVDSKSVTPADGSVVEAGDQLTYTLAFENTGTAGGDVDRDDYLGLWQDDAVLVDPPGIQVTGPVGVTAVRNGDRIEVRGPLAPGETATVTYTVEVKSDADRVADGGDDQLGNALVDPGATPPTECLPQDDEDSTCNPVPRIVDSKSVNPADGTSVVAGSELTYTLTFTNEGKGTDDIERDDYLGLWQDDAVLVDPPGIQVTGPVGVTAVRNGDRIEVRGPLAPGETATVTYTVEVKSDADRVADGGDDQLGNALIDPGATPPTECLPQDDEDSTCNPVGQVSAEKTVDPEDGSTVAGGEEITYTLTFTNPGRGAASVNHVDRLGGVLDDADLVREPRASGGALTVVRDGSRIRITGELAGGATVRVSYVVQVKPYDEQADHVLENFLVPSGVASASCSAGDPSCTRNPIDPPAEQGAIPETGGPQLLWLGGALALLVCGGWLVVSGRRRA